MVKVQGRLAEQEDAIPVRTNKCTLTCICITSPLPLITVNQGLHQVQYMEDCTLGIGMMALGLVGETFRLHLHHISFPCFRFNSSCFLDTIVYSKYYYYDVQLPTDTLQ